MCDSAKILILTSDSSLLSKTATIEGLGLLTVSICTTR